MGSLIISLLVGTIVTLVNRGDALFDGNLSLALAWVVPLNYVVSLVLVLTSGRLTNLEDELPSPLDSPSDHIEQRLGR